MINSYDPDDPFLQPPEREVLRATLSDMKRRSAESAKVREDAKRRYDEAEARKQALYSVRDHIIAKAQAERERATRFGAQGADYGAPMLAASAMLFTAVSPGPLQLAIAAVVALLQWRYWMHRVRQRADAIAPEGA